MYSHVDLFRVMYGHVDLCRIMYGHVTCVGLGMAM